MPPQIRRRLYANMETIIRPWIPVTSKPKVRERSPPDEQLPEAHIRWGAASEFSTGDSFRDTAGNPGFQVIDEEPPVRKRVSYSSIATAWVDFRVENPVDPAQYAIMRAAAGFAMDIGDERVIFSMTPGNAIPNTEEGEGQEPPFPPMDEIEE